MLALVGTFVCAWVYAFHEIDHGWALEERRSTGAAVIEEYRPPTTPAKETPYPVLVFNSDADSALRSNWSLFVGDDGYVTLGGAEDNPPPRPIGQLPYDFDRVYVGFRRGGGVMVDRETGEVRHCASMRLDEEAPKCEP